MRYVEARLTEKTHALIYRIYVTDALQTITGNTGNVAGAFGGGQSISKRYHDIVRPPKEETRTAKDIIDGIKERLDALRE